MPKSVEESAAFDDEQRTWTHKDDGNRLWRLGTIGWVFARKPLFLEVPALGHHQLQLGASK